MLQRPVSAPRASAVPPPSRRARPASATSAFAHSRSTPNLMSTTSKIKPSSSAHRAHQIDHLLDHLSSTSAPVLAPTKFDMGWLEKQVYTRVVSHVRQPIAQSNLAPPSRTPPLPPRFTPPMRQQDLARRLDDQLLNRRDAPDKLTHMLGGAASVGGRACDALSSPTSPAQLRGPGFHTTSATASPTSPAKRPSFRAPPPPPVITTAPPHGGARSVGGTRQQRALALAALHARSAEEYVELTFEASNNSIFDALDMDACEGVLTAAREFDARQMQLTDAARKSLVQLERWPADLGTRASHMRHTHDVRRNRYIMRERLEHAMAIKGRARRRRKRTPWRLDTSVWAERKASGNSLDFFETPEALRAMFDVDWAIASKAHSLAWHIVKCQRDPRTWKSLERGGNYGEVDEVRDALWEHAKLIYGAYDYYACLYSESGEPVGDDSKAAVEVDVYNISFASFMNMCEHNGMVSRQAPAGEFEVIWSIVNAKDKALSAEEDKHNQDKFLNRQEFLQCLVRCAVAVFVKRGTMGDVSDAVHQLIVGKLMGNLQKRCPAAVQSSNAFRTRFCYIEHTSVVLEAYVGSLRTLYENYAEVSREVGDTMRDDDLMSIGEWLAFVRHMGLVEARQLSLTQAKHIFLWSRIRSVNGTSDKAESRLRHLRFEDFLEALVRMATMMAFPTQVSVTSRTHHHTSSRPLASCAPLPLAHTLGPLPDSFSRVVWCRSRLSPSGPATPVTSSSGCAPTRPNSTMPSCVRTRPSITTPMALTSTLKGLA